MPKVKNKLEIETIFKIRNNREEIYTLINRENVNYRGYKKRTALFESAVTGRLEMSEYFIGIGADVNISDKDGFTPLHFAAIYYRVEILKLLLEKGAVIDAQDSWGNTALSRAVYESKGRGDVIKLLLENGANRNLKNYYDISPLDLANKIANYDIKQFFT